VAESAAERAYRCVPRGGAESSIYGAVTGALDQLAELEAVGVSRARPSTCCTVTSTLFALLGREVIPAS
jgi:hypothetical protein